MCPYFQATRRLSSPVTPIALSTKLIDWSTRVCVSAISYRANNSLLFDEAQELRRISLVSRRTR
jgi:hypothetical protein